MCTRSSDRPHSSSEMILHWILEPIMHPKFTIPSDPQTTTKKTIPSALKALNDLSIRSATEHRIPKDRKPLSEGCGSCPGLCSQNPICLVHLFQNLVHVNNFTSCFPELQWGQANVTLPGSKQVNLHWKASSSSLGIQALCLLQLSLHYGPVQLQPFTKKEIDNFPS